MIRKKKAGSIYVAAAAAIIIIVSGCLGWPGTVRERESLSITFIALFFFFCSCSSSSSRLCVYTAWMQFPPDSLYMCVLLIADRQTQPLPHKHRPNFFFFPLSHRDMSDEKIVLFEICQILILLQSRYGEKIKMSAFFLIGPISENNRAPDNDQ